MLWCCLINRKFGPWFRNFTRKMWNWKLFSLSQNLVVFCVWNSKLNYWKGILMFDENKTFETTVRPFSFPHRPFFYVELLFPPFYGRWDIRKFISENHSSVQKKYSMFDQWEQNLKITWFHRFLGNQTCPYRTRLHVYIYVS